MTALEGDQGVPGRCIVPRQEPINIDVNENGSVTLRQLHPWDQDGPHVIEIQPEYLRSVIDALSSAHASTQGGQ